MLIHVSPGGKSRTIESEIWQKDHRIATDKAKGRRIFGGHAYNITKLTRDTATDRYAYAYTFRNRNDWLSRHATDTFLGPARLGFGALSDLRRWSLGSLGTFRCLSKSQDISIISPIPNRDEDDYYH
jgi:hypothetical protein